MGGPAKSLDALARHEQWAILECATGRSRTFFLREGLNALSSAESALVDRWANQRLQGMPLAYILGFREFYGHRFWVNRAVLIPRSATELLVDEAKPLLSPGACLLELGTGSGCIIISILKEAKARGIPLTATATDLSAKALATARNNGVWHDTEVQWAEGRWFAAVPRTTFDVIVTNPPYIAHDDPHLRSGDLPFEPREALVGAYSHGDGLDDLRTIIHASPGWLRPGGTLLIEHGWQQQHAALELCQQAGFRHIVGLSDLSGIPRAVRARL